MRGSVMQAELAGIVVGSPYRAPRIERGELALEERERPVFTKISYVIQVGVGNPEYIQEEKGRRLIETAAAEQIIGGDHSYCRRIQTPAAAVRRIGANQVCSARLHGLEYICPILCDLWAYLRNILSKLVRRLACAINLCEGGNCLV